MKGKVIVTGGAGYIGSHTIVDLQERGYDIISIDNYINSSPEAYKQIKTISGKNVTHYDADICDQVALNKVFEKEGEIIGVIHFAALKAVGESVEKPLWYYKNNILGLVNILESCIKYRVKSFIFSSSCTVYGIPEHSPVDESTPLQDATSPYGATKQFGERIVTDSVAGNSLKAILLRYFNPAGAHPSGKMGESPINKANNLVPAITETAIGKRDSLAVFGTDYSTRDGSCVRDYIHVMDLARAHSKALEYLINERQSDDIDIFNLGIGEGVTVLEIIRAFEQISGEKLNYKLTDRRPGDVPAIYSNYQKINKVLNWSPRYSIQDIMETAWNWEKRRNS